MIVAAMPLVRLSLLGGFVATDGAGQPLTLPTRKTEALLAYLALSRGRALRREVLARLLWAGSGIEQAQGSLRQALTALRRGLGPGAEGALEIDARHGTVALDPAAAEADALEFEALAAAGASPASLRRAIAVYRGDLLEGFDLKVASFAAWRAREAVRLRGLAVAALLSLLKRAEAGDAEPEDGAEVAAAARRLLELDPLQQAAHRALMRHYAELGQPALALDQYGQCLTLLAQGLGVAPSADTERLREALLPRSGAAAPAPIEPAPGPALPDRPSVAVLPFANLGAAGQDYFAEGLAEELITALAHIPWLFVVARGSSFALQGPEPVDLRRVARELGVRYVLRGSVRRAGDRVRIAGQLADAATAATLWADRFDGTLADVFGLQDRVAEAVAGAVAPRLEAAEVERARRKPPGSLDAWDLTLRALPLIHGMTRQGQEEALGLLGRATALDPAYALPLGLAAWCRTLRVPQRWGDPAEETREGLGLARRAIAAGPDDAEALAMGGYALSFLGRAPAAGLAAIDRALALNPNSARGFTFSGWVRVYAGEHEAATDHFARALRLSPLDPMAYRTRAGLAFAHLYAGRLEDAAAVARRALEEQPNFSPAHRALAAALAHLGRREEAGEVVRRALAVVPGLTTSYALAEARFTRPADRAVLEAGLRLAGLPE